MKIAHMRGETLTLATTVGYSQVLGAPPGANMLEVEVPSATKENISLLLTPKLRHIWYYDDSATDKYTNFTKEFSDRNTSTGSGTSLNTFATADFIYFGGYRRFRGLAVNVANTNGTGSVATVKYWDGTAWTDITATDGTISGAQTLGQDGLITWTVPTDWTTTTVNGVADLYWVRYSVGTALDATVSIIEVYSLANLTLNSTNTDAEGQDYVLLQSNAQSLPPYRYYFDSERYGGVEMKSASITSAANLNWYTCVGGY